MCSSECAPQVSEHRCLPHRRPICFCVPGLGRRRSTVRDASALGSPRQCRPSRLEAPLTIDASRSDISNTPQFRTPAARLTPIDVATPRAPQKGGTMFRMPFVFPMPNPADIDTAVMTGEVRQ